MIRKIIQIGSEILTKKSVNMVFPLSGEDKGLVSDLFDTVKKVGDKGAGLSAPQIGVNKRIAVCRRLDVEELLTHLNTEKYLSKDLDYKEIVKILLDSEDILLEGNVEKAVKLLRLEKVEKKLDKGSLLEIFRSIDDLLWQFILNPKILKENDYETIYWEGCLSVGTGKNALYAPVARSEIIEYEYTDIDGKVHRSKASNYFAHAILHELDHLDGILFISRVSNIKNIWRSDKLDLYIKEHKKYPEIVQ